MAGLCHPRIVRSFMSGELGGVPFIVMEYCQGGSLLDIVSREGPLPVAEALCMARDVLDGLAYAHAAPMVVTAPGGAPIRATGIVHRDLKPHNVLVSTENGARRFKIADFGLAKAFELAGFSSVTRTNAMGGTPAFMPRQQAINFKYAQPEVDVWSAAACLYFALTGCPPRDLVADRDPWLQVWTTAAVPVTQRGMSLPDGLCRIIDKALVDRPEISFSAASEFRDALDAACRWEGIDRP
jgi:serine/threonine protein kinase